VALILRPILPDKHAGRVGADLHIARMFSFLDSNPRQVSDGNLTPTVLGELGVDLTNKTVWWANGLTVADWLVLRDEPVRKAAEDAFSTISATKVLITSGTGDDMLIQVDLQAEGLYLVVFSAVMVNSNAATELEVSLNVGGVEQTVTRRRHLGLTESSTTFVALVTVITGQAIEVRAERLSGGGTSTINERVLFARRVA
jgi:hypothetical protein